MTTERYLEQITNIDRRIKDKLADSRRWEEIAIARSMGGSLSQEGERIQSSPKPDKISDAIIKAVDYCRQAEEQANELAKVFRVITEQIDGIDDEVFYNILRGKFVDGKSLTILADDMGFSTRTIFRKYDDALVCFETKYGESYLKL